MFYLVIRTENLTKNYGRKIGVQDLTLEVEPGEVFGLLGTTGSGKINVQCACCWILSGLPRAGRWYWARKFASTARRSAGRLDFYHPFFHSTAR